MTKSTTTSVQWQVVNRKEKREDGGRNCISDERDLDKEMTLYGSVEESDASL